MTLIDNGSAINVCPLRTAQKLGIPQEEFKENAQSIRAYDNTRRETLGVIWLNIISGPVERKVKFHVMDIKTNFNLLLGRPWLHELGVIPSTLHQKLKFLVGNIQVTINACPMKMQINDKPVIHVEHDEQDEDLWGFNVSMIAEEDKVPFDFNPYSNLVINALLRAQGHFPGMTLGLHKARALSMPKPTMKNDTFGLGYAPSAKERCQVVQKRMAAKSKKKGEKIDTFIHPYPLTLNGQFMKQGDEAPYYEFPEPFVGADGRKYPGIEVFADCNFLEEGITDPAKSEHDITDVMGLGLLFGQEKGTLDGEDVFATINMQDFDPTKLITKVDHMVQGWRKTLKITTPQGKIVEITVGEGPMFEESESEPESEDESESESSIKKLSPKESVLGESVKEFSPSAFESLSVIPTAVPVSSETSFDVMVSAFNEMIISAYSSSSSDCFNNQTEIKDDDELIKAMEEHEKKTPVIEETEKINISDNEIV
jgi:hypothetical protein